MTERITAEAVEAAVVEYDAQDRAVVAGQVVMNFTQVGVLVSLLSPEEWEAVAGYLAALVEREPVKSGKAYVAHRTVFGAIAGELHGYARAAGVPVGLELDLRAAGSKAEERRIRERISDHELAFDRYIDEVIESQHVQAEAAAAIHEERTPDEPTQPAAPEPTDDDLAAWS